MLAANAHAGQKDLGGHPYIGHLLRVSSRFLDERFQVVAILHDIVEDTSVTLGFIETKFGKEIRDAVDAISRRKDESNRAYIKRVRQNKIARKVKLVDIRDNMRRDRAPGNEKVEHNRKVMFDSLRMLDARESDLPIVE